MTVPQSAPSVHSDIGAQPPPVKPDDAGVRYRPIEGHYGYCVGDDGTVWSCLARRQPRVATNAWRKREPNPDRNGYHWLHLYNYGPGERSYRRRLIHNLVLESFVGPRPPGAVTRHLDGSRSNNRLANLCWGTPTENAADKVRHGTVLLGEQCHKAKLTPDAVKHLRSLRAAGISVSTRSLVERFGVTPSTLRKAARGEAWSHV